MGRGDGRERHGQLAADPLHGPAAPAVDRGTGRARHPGAAWRGRAYWGPYGISKAAVELLARTYASENETTAICVNLFNPGPIRTRMRAQAMPGEDPETLEPPEAVAAKILELCLPDCSHNGRLYNYPDKRFLDFRPPA